MTLEALTVRDYVAFLRRRWRFIASGCLASAALMLVVSMNLPDVYSAWVVIDTGTLGKKFPHEVDRYRDQFNEGEYRRVVERFAPETVLKVWLRAAPPLVMIRADAVNGDSAAKAAREAARAVVTGLTRIPIQRDIDAPPSAADATITAIRDTIALMLLRVEQVLATERAEARDVQFRTSEGTAELVRLAEAGQIRSIDGRWRLEARKLKGLADMAVTLEARITTLDGFRHQLQRAATGAMPQRAVDALSRAAQLDLASTASVEAATSELRDLLDDRVGPPIEPVRVMVQPVAPTAPTWPNHLVNVLIALIFGLIGAVFAAVLLEPDVDAANIERT